VRAREKCSGVTQFSRAAKNCGVHSRSGFRCGKSPVSLGVLVGCPGVLAAQVAGIYAGPDFVVRQKLFVPLDVWPYHSPGWSPTSAPIVLTLRAPWTIQDTRGASFDAISPALIKLESH
jgi:hypothetical protein